jgi:hypothetical protein
MNQLPNIKDELAGQKRHIDELEREVQKLTETLKFVKGQPVVQGYSGKRFDLNDNLNVVLLTKKIVDGDAAGDVLLGTHIDNTGNPHNTTAAQVGAPALVAPSVDGNFVAFNGVAGAQKDSGKKASDFLTSLPAHDLNGTAHNALTGAVEDNFLSSNATGKPKDSGKKAADFDAAGAAAAITLAGLGGVPLTRHITTALDLSADRNLGASDVGADAAGTAAGAVSVHAALLTGVHGLAITAGKTLTVEDDTSLKASSVQLKNFTATLEKTGTVIVKTNVASGSVAAGWWRFAQSSSLPCNGIFKIKYYRGTTLHSMIVQVGIFDGCTTPNISILSNTLGT